MKRSVAAIAIPIVLLLGACQGETTEVEQPVVTDAVDTGVDPIDTDVEAAPVTGGTAVAAPGTEADVGEVGPSDLPGNQVDVLNVTDSADTAALNGM